MEWLPQGGRQKSLEHYGRGGNKVFLEGWEMCEPASQTGFVPEHGLSKEPSHARGAFETRLVSLKKKNSLKSK